MEAAQTGEQKGTKAVKSCETGEKGRALVVRSHGPKLRIWSSDKGHSC